MWLFFLFIAVPLIEIALFVELGGWLGLLPTLAIVLVTAALGTVLVRRQGLAALRDIQSGPADAERLAAGLMNGILILAAGLLLLTPGFLTDSVGFLLLIPPVRQWAIENAIGQMTIHAFRGGMSVRPGPPNGPSQDDITDADWSEVSQDRDPSSEPQGQRRSGWTNRPDT